MQLAEDKKQKICDKSLASIKHWLERFDTIIIGPGLGRDEMVHHVVIEVTPVVCAPLTCWLSPSFRTLNQTGVGCSYAAACSIMCLSTPSFSVTLLHWERAGHSAITPCNYACFM